MVFGDVWQPPLELQKEFERVNSGRHPEFTLPKRIELVIPSAILGDESLSVTLIDTQGIDDQAPQTEVRRLLQRAKEAGVRTLGTNAALVVLPRPGDALVMKDNGYPVDSASDGCALKSEEVDLKLHELGLTGLERVFFNSAEDEPEVLREFVAARIAAVQDAHRRSLREIVELLEAKLRDFRAIVNNILQGDQLSEAHDLARQVARTVDDGFDSVYSAFRRGQTSSFMASGPTMRPMGVPLGR